MGHLGVTLQDVERSTLAELEELGALLDAGHAAEKRARESAERESKRRR
jgi:hypothetical protein